MLASLLIYHGVSHLATYRIERRLDRLPLFPALLLTLFPSFTALTETRDQPLLIQYSNNGGSTANGQNGTTQIKDNNDK